ncbi:MAG TPA: response regulator [Chthoniobacterales bacterium]|nr:response regulator [Chthoniobacterales bacterium]
MQGPRTEHPSSIATTSELNNLLHIISGTTGLLGNIWDGNPDSEKYLAMLRASVERAAEITAERVAEAGGANSKLVLQQTEPTVPRTRHIELVRRTKPRILLVDDERMALELFEQLLSADGYDVVTAQSGFECLDLFVRNDADFDLVVLDLTMPFMNGEETFRRLREICSNVRVVLSTGFIHEERLTALFEAGLSGFMRKPLPPDELLSNIARFVGCEQFAPTDGIQAAL